MRYDKIQRREDKLRGRLKQAEADRDQVYSELAKVREVLEDMMHEVRRFSEDLTSATHHLHRQLQDESSKTSLIEKCNTIFYTSGMISVRLNLSDLELNPALFSQKQKVRAGIYKKFEKAKYVLSTAARAKGVSVRFEGSSFSEIEAITAFDFVPFVILDNAIKYTPDSQPVEVKFFDDNNGRDACVEVSSLGPTLYPEELSDIFERGYRGHNALKSERAGEGLGLALAKELCDMHGVGLEVIPRNQNQFDLDGIEYAEFCIRLTWNK